MVKGMIKVTKKVVTPCYSCVSAQNYKLGFLSYDTLKTKCGSCKDMFKSDFVIRFILGAAAPDLKDTAAYDEVLRLKTENKRLAEYNDELVRKLDEKSYDTVAYAEIMRLQRENRYLSVQNGKLANELNEMREIRRKSLNNIGHGRTRKLLSTYGVRYIAAKEQGLSIRKSAPIIGTSPTSVQKISALISRISDLAEKGYSLDEVVEMTLRDEGNSEEQIQKLFAAQKADITGFLNEFNKSRGK